MTERIETVIVGGGQAGLSTSYYLTQEGREHVILEKHHLGESWKSRKWDSFTLVTPNWQLQLPGHAYDGNDPQGFLNRDEIVAYLDSFVDGFDPPVRLGVEVIAVEPLPDGDGYAVRTDAGDIKANNVVMATGTFQKPHIPGEAQRVAPHVTQLHSSMYRNPERLPPGAVLVVGSGQSGCQIAEELHQSGRQVYLCTSGVGRAPRRYRGRDFTRWLADIGVIDETVDTLSSPAERFVPNPHVTGQDGGHTINLHRFARDGVTLLGHFKSVDGNSIQLADDLHDNLVKADKFAAELRQGVDKFISEKGLDAPEPELQELEDGFDVEPITELDLETAGINAIIWATGYDFDYSLVRLPVFDEFGYPEQERGVTEHPGLYFIGLHWMHTLKSGLFLGIADDAAHVATHLCQRG